MKEEIIQIETAQLAKEKGFNIPTKAGYVFDNWDKADWHLFEESLSKHYNSDIEPYGDVSAPTQSLLQKWLREVHNIHIDISPNYFYKKDGFASWKLIIENNYFKDKYKTYEEALEVGLIKALELI